MVEDRQVVTMRMVPAGGIGENAVRIIAGRTSEQAVEMAAGKNHEHTFRML
jgi:hypothetical protein